MKFPKIIIGKNSIKYMHFYLLVIFLAVTTAFAFFFTTSAQIMQNPSQKLPTVIVDAGHGGLTNTID